MITVGLDVSSKVAGWAKLKGNDIIDFGYYTFKGEEDIDRSLEFKNNLLPLIKGHDLYILEDRMKGMSGMTTAQTLFPLAHINASVELLLTLEYGKENVQKIHVSSARKKAIGVGKLTKKTATELGYIKARKIDTKLWVFDEVKKIYGELFTSKDYKNTGRPREYCFDICDAIILARNNS